MRRIRIAAIVLLLSLFLTACGGTTPEGGSADSGKVSGTEQVGEGTVGKYTVKFTDAALAKDYDGKDVIIVSYDFTNNDEETTSAMVSLVVKAFQDGVELERAYFLDGADGYDADNIMKDLKTGATLNCQEAYILSSMSSPVEVEAKASFSFSDEKVTYTYQLAE